MLKSATPVTPGILDGRIEQLRVSVPTPMGDVYLRVDGVPVVGTIEDAAMGRTVRGLQDQSAPVRVGVLTDTHGTHHFSWLIARKGPGVPPRFYVNERRNGWRGAGIGLLLAVTCVGVAWSSLACPCMRCGSTACIGRPSCGARRPSASTAGSHLW